MTLAVITYLLALFVLGWVILGFFRQTLGGVERAGLAYPIGAGIFTLAVFVAANTGMPITLVSAGVIFAALLLPCLWFVRQNHSSLFITLECPQLELEQIILIGLVGILVLTAFVGAIYMPPVMWDALSFWVLKAKLMAATGEIAPQAQASWPFYPLNLSLQITFLFLLGGDFLQIVIPVYFLSFLLLFYANLRQWIGTTLALACTLFLGATPIIQEYAKHAYANLPFAVYYVGSAIYLLRFLKDKKTSWLVLSGILIGLASWTRAESLLYLVINLLTLLLFTHFTRTSFKHAFAYLGIYAIFGFPWNLYSKLSGYDNELSKAALGGLVSLVSGNLNLSLLEHILRYALASAQATTTWGLLWPGLLVALLLSIKYWREHAALLCLLVLNFVSLIYTYYSASVTSHNSVDWWLGTGFERMALHWAPLSVFYMGLVIGTTSLPKEIIARFLKDKYLLLLLLFSLFAIAPLFAPGYFWGAHDGRHSIYFLFEFDRSIRDGIFYPRWAPDYAFGYGYPMFNIYAPGALYVSEALHLIGFDFVTATKIVFALAIVLSGVAMFAFIKHLTGSSQAAFLSGVAYIYIPYHIADVYVRAALAESVALIFLPLTLWGFYETVTRPNRTTIVATAFAYAAMMFSHNGVAMLFTVVLGAWVLFLMINGLCASSPSLSCVLRLSSFARLGLPSLAALLLGLGIVAIFFIPAVLEYQYVRTDQWLGNYYDYTHHFTYFFQLFSPTWGFGISKPGPADEMSFQLGVVPVLLAIFSIIAIVRNPRGTRRFWIFFLALTVIVTALMLGLARPLWEIARPILSFAQFPWRLLTLTMVPLAALAGAIILTDETEENARALSLPAILLGVLIVWGSFPYLNAQMILEPKEGPVSILGLFRFQQSAGEMTGSTAWVKEIPEWSPMADVYFAGKKLKSKIDYTHIDPHKIWIGVLPNFAGFKANSEQIVYHAQEDTIITFNTFYYPGWRAYLTKPNSTEIIRELPLDVDPNDPLGRIRVHVPAGREQWLLVRFDDTPPRIIGTWISALSILLALGLLVTEVRGQKSEVRDQRAEGRRQ
jgi:hypothetical protein